VALVPVATSNVPTLVCVRQDTEAHGRVARNSSGSPKGDAQPGPRGSVGLARDLDWESNAYCSSRRAVKGKKRPTGVLRMGIRIEVPELHVSADNARTREAFAEMDATNAMAQFETASTSGACYGYRSISLQQDKFFWRTSSITDSLRRGAPSTRYICHGRVTWAQGGTGPGAQSRLSAALRRAACGQEDRLEEEGLSWRSLSCVIPIAAASEGSPGLLLLAERKAR
jgi:hypothetical protein